MALKQVSYVERDYQSIVADVVNKIKTEYGDNWNDEYEDSLAMMLIEAFAYIFDKLNYCLDRQANEAYLPTATERQNTINLCKLIAYTVGNAASAAADITFSIDSTIDAGVAIPALTQIETKDGVVFETTEAAILQAGELNVTVGAIQGETFEEYLGTSSGEASQEYEIARTGILEIKKVTIDGYDWEAVDSVLDHDAGAKCYMVELGGTGTAQIIFGDGVHGCVPPEEEVIYVTYRTTVGASGNVATNTITITREQFVDDNGESVVVSVRNAAPATGGADAETLARIRKWAPKVYETQNRAVTADDYATKAMTYGSSGSASRIAKCRAVATVRTGEANVITLYVLAYSTSATGVGLASQALKDALAAYMDQYKMLTDWVEVADATWMPITFKGTITLLSGFNAATVKPEVEAAIKDLLNIEVRELGEDVKMSDLYGAIESVDGVNYVEISYPSATLVAAKNELFTVGGFEFQYEEQ